MIPCSACPSWRADQAGPSRKRWRSSRPATPRSGTRSNTNLELCDQTVKVPRHETLPEQFHTVDFRLCTASAVVAAPSSPECATEVFRRPEGLVARGGTSSGRLPRLGVLARRNDGVGTALCDRIVALASVIGTVGSDAGNLLIERDLVVQLGQHGGVAHIAGGDLDRPDFQCLLVDPEMDLAADAALGAAMLARVPLAPPSTLIPVLSISRCSGPCAPRCGMFTASVFWRRLSVLKSGTSQSRPMRRSRLSIKPVVCRSAMPKRTFIVRQVWTAASL